MRLLLRSLILRIVFTVVLDGLVFLTRSEGAWCFLYPAVRGTDFLVGSRIATSDSGLENLLYLVLTSSALNVLIYTLVFFTGFEIALRFRRGRKRRCASGS
jgi:hypothetical protein